MLPCPLLTTFAILVLVCHRIVHGMLRIATHSIIFPLIPLAERAAVHNTLRGRSCCAVWPSPLSVPSKSAIQSVLCTSFSIDLLRCRFRVALPPSVLHILTHRRCIGYQTKWSCGHGCSIVRLGLLYCCSCGGRCRVRSRRLRHCVLNRLPKHWMALHCHRRSGSVTNSLTGRSVRCSGCCCQLLLMVQIPIVLGR